MMLYDCEELLLEFEDDEAIIYANDEKTGHKVPITECKVNLKQNTISIRLLGSDQPVCVTVLSNVDLPKLAEINAPIMVAIRTAIPFVQEVYVKESLFSSTEKPTTQMLKCRVVLRDFLSRLYEYYGIVRKVVKIEKVPMEETDPKNPVNFLLIRAVDKDRATISIRGDVVGTIYYDTHFEIKMIIVDAKTGKRYPMPTPPWRGVSHTNEKTKEELNALQPFFPKALTLVYSNEVSWGRANTMMDEIKTWIWRYYGFYGLSLVKLDTNTYLIEELDQTRTTKEAPTS